MPHENSRSSVLSYRHRYPDDLHWRRNSWVGDAMTARLVGVMKPATYRNQKIRDSARGKECLMHIPGVCTHDPSKTIWSHYRGLIGGKARGLKADDLCGCYACTDCDAVYDGQRRPPMGMDWEEVELAWFEAHIKSIVILHAEGIIK